MGELAGLAAALVWSTTNIVLRGQSVRLGAVTVNAWRTLFAALCFVAIFALTRQPGDLLGIPPGSLAALLISVIAGMVIGDTMQFVAMARIGVAKAMPISSTFPLFTIIIAAVVLHERITAWTIGGAVCVIVGVVLVALPRAAKAAPGTVEKGPPPRQYWLGVGLALVAALCWSISTTLTRVGIRDTDVITANMIRLPFSAAVSFLINTRSGGLPIRKFGRRSVVILVLAGVIGSAGGGFLYLTAIDLAGAAKTAVLASAAPIFGLVGAVLFLHERPGGRSVAGTLLAVLGIAFVVL